MTPNEFGRMIAVYPALLRSAYTGEPVALAPDDARALLAVLDSVDAEVTAPSAPLIRTLWDPILSDTEIDFVMPCDADRPDRVLPRASVREPVTPRTRVARRGLMTAGRLAAEIERGRDRVHAIR